MAPGCSGSSNVQIRNEPRRRAQRGIVRSDLPPRMVLVGLLAVNGTGATVALEPGRSVRRRGLEPPRPFGHWYLKPARLPFRHLRKWGATFTLPRSGPQAEADAQRQQFWCSPVRRSRTAGPSRNGGSYLRAIEHGREFVSLQGEPPELPRRSTVNGTRSVSTRVRQASAPLRNKIENF